MKATDVSNKKAPLEFKKNWVVNILIAVVLIIASLAIILPLLITVFASFKSLAQIGSEFPLKPPSELNFDSYVTAFVKGKILIGLKNSITLVALSLVFNIILGTTSAYALARFNFKLKGVIMAIFMLGMILPSNLTEIPRFIILSRLGTYNTLVAPTVIYAATDLIQLSMYLTFVKSIPVSLDESARIDGCTYFGVFTRIILPLMKPGIATMAIIKTVWVVNDMYVPYLYMPSSELRTLTTTLMTFSNARQGTWNNLSAAIVLVALPTVILYLFFQKHILGGIVAGAVKE